MVNDVCSEKDNAGVSMPRQATKIGSLPPLGLRSSVVHQRQACTICQGLQPSGRPDVQAICWETCVAPIWFRTALLDTQEN